MVLPRVSVRGGHSFDSCYYEFTPQHVLRMQYAWLEWRAP